MAFSKDRLIVAQNSATATATIIASMDFQSVEEVLMAFDAIRTHVFEGSLDLADGVIAGQTEVEQRTSNASASTGGGSSDGGAGIALKFGKYQGSTIGEVYAKDAKYIDWLASTSNNEFIKGKCAEFLRSVNA